MRETDRKRHGNNMGNKGLRDKNVKI